MCARASAPIALLLFGGNTWIKEKSPSVSVGGRRLPSALIGNQREHEEESCSERNAVGKQASHISRFTELHVFKLLFSSAWTEFLVFSANFNEHLTKSREKGWHRSKAPCQMYQYALIDSSTGLGSTLYPSFLSNSLFSGGGKSPPPLTIINMVKNILSIKNCSLPFAKTFNKLFNSEKNLKNKLLKYLLFFLFHHFLTFYK